MKTKTIGMNLNLPKERCNDKKCPFHGLLRLHGRIFKGKITKSDLNRTSTVEFLHFFYLPKYERYQKKITSLKVHNPACINAKIGDEVKIVESKPISKTKNFVIVEVLKK